MMKRCGICLLIICMVFALAYGCSEKDSTTGPVENEQSKDGRIIVTNNEASLSSRMTYKSEEIEVDTLGVAGGAKKKIPVGEDLLSLVLVSEVSPPVYEGITLQATDIQIKDTFAYVSYNVAGETFLGGVDIFDISDPSTPLLISNALFTDTDVNGIALDGEYLYLASSTYNPLLYSSYAILERVPLLNGRLTPESTVVDIPSWAATDVDVNDLNVFVTSGADNGYVSILSKDTLAKIDSVAVDDARGVYTEPLSMEVAVVAGTPARLYMFAGTLTPTVHTLEGATIPYSKSTVEVWTNNAIIALGDGGTQIVDTATGTVLHTIPQPIVEGLAPEVTVTNAASTTNKLIFMACGEAGIYISSITKGSLASVKESSEFADVGSFSFGVGQSANHVTYRGETLFVASGLGGIKIIHVNITGSPKIEVSPTSFDIKDVSIGSSDSGSFIITNDGTAYLVISDISCDKEEFTVSPTSATIAPGNSQEVTVTFSPATVGDQNATVTITSNDSDKGAFEVSIKGIGEAPAPEIAVSPTSIDIGSVPVGSSDSASFTITNDGTIDLVVNDISSDKEEFTVSPTSATIAPGNSQEVTVTFSPITKGSQSVTIKIMSNDSENETFDVDVIGTGEAPKIEVSPTSFDIKDVPVGSSDLGSFIITNDGTADLIVSDISIDNDAFTVSPTSATISPGNSQEVTVTFSPATAGDQYATITITSNDSDKGAFEVNIKGIGM